MFFEPRAIDGGTSAENSASISPSSSIWSSVVSVPMCCTLMCGGGFCLYQGSGGVGRSTPPM